MKFVTKEKPKAKEVVTEKKEKQKAVRKQKCLSIATDVYNALVDISDEEGRTLSGQIKVMCVTWKKIMDKRKEKITGKEA